MDKLMKETSPLGPKHLRLCVSQTPGRARHTEGRPAALLGVSVGAVPGPGAPSPGLGVSCGSVGLAVGDLCPSPLSGQ